ncbi:MAG TPA: hypothetical protein VJ508_05280, partial [Saprospiraceae bacterium]|nr:hypothetical protein [Saprospiraceae bacterium]
WTISLDPDVGEYIWQDGSTDPDYVITSPGIYSVTVVNPCGSDFDHMVVEYTGQPIIDLGPDVTLCPQQLPYTLDETGTLNVDHFLWSTGEITPLISVSGSGQYSLIVSNACFIDMDSIMITVDTSMLQVHLPADTILCPGSSILLDVGSIPGNYLWQDSTSGSSFLVTNNGQYSVTISNACGQASDAVNILFDDQLPALDLGPDLTLCPGTSAILYAGVTGVQYIWNDGSNADSLVVSGPDTIALTISNNCASRSDTVQIDINAAAPDAGLPTQLSMCEGDTLTFGTAIIGATYLWNTGAITPSVVATQPGLYILTVTNTCGTDIDTTAVLDLGTAPVFDLGPSFAKCMEDTLLLDPGIPGNYLWQDGSTNQSFIAVDSGIISLAVTNACGMTTDSVHIAWLPGIPSLELGNDVSFCSGDSVVIAPGISGVNYSWQDGSTSASFIVKQAGIIRLTISNACGTSSDSLLANIAGFVPQIDLGADTVLCEGQSITLQIDTNGAAILWENGQTSPVRTITLAGIYSATISNTCGSDIDSLVVTTS